MEVTLGLMADAANISREGKLNVLGAFNRINAITFPTRHPEFTLVLRMEASPAERGERKAILLRLLDADGQQVQQIEAHAEIPTDTGRLGFRSYVLLAIRNMVVSAPGEYAFHVLINGEEKRVIRFEVTEVASERPNG